MSTDAKSSFESLAAKMKKNSADSMEDWVKNQKELLKDYRKLVEERSKDDSDLFTRLTKSYMATAFKMLEIQKKSLEMAEKAHLEHIDKYLEHLDTLSTGEDGKKPPAKASKRKS